jgi:hypothetical protein
MKRINSPGRVRSLDGKLKFFDDVSIEETAKTVHLTCKCLG